MNKESEVSAYELIKRKDKGIEGTLPTKSHTVNHSITVNCGLGKGWPVVKSNERSKSSEYDNDS